MSATQSRPSRPRALLAGAALLATLTASALTGGSIAQAASAPTITTDGNFCAVNVSTGKTACVASEQDYPAAKAAALGTSATSAAAVNNFLAGRFFDNVSRDTSAGFIDFFVSSSCNTSSTSTPDFSWSDTTTWRGRISSYEGFSNCRIKAFEKTLYAGASVGYSLFSNNVGVLNDHVWSVYFS